MSDSEELKFTKSSGNIFQDLGYREAMKAAQYKQIFSPRVLLQRSGQSLRF